MSYAHWSVRVVAFLIDILACAAPNIIAGVVSPDSTGLQVGLCVLFLLLLAYDRWYLAGRTGQSWGKRLMDLRLLRLEGTGPVGVPRALLRDLAHLLDSIPCFLGWFWPLWDRRRQTFADKLAATAVLGGEE
ncbi:RDD family protein [Kitasatospora kifunensis]|uniref:Putative RDD family membrane protein YckC n=1 Tax=Kitasatospora kifunensis TaxID=58351 RepID=A0A7W7QX60_KITKI|nr:RDD family protein [Kitasatospora kifunensis]MBB4921392.1 putative RDD family membrane protein YckC [Kitasatospora kifunensis]